MATTSLPDTHIISASLQDANSPISGASARASDGSGKGSLVAGLPAFCRVIGSIHPELGSDIRFEVWLPVAGWNGRYMGVGNGGFAGSIRYRDLADALGAGYVTSSTDTGHEAEAADESTWARGNPVKIRDYGWRAVHLTAVTAKHLLASYYGVAARHSYFQSCSNGGRQGLMEAWRFPEDYDGILAGAPAAEFTRAVLTHVWTQQVQRAPGAALRPEQMHLLQSEVIKQCDARDGLIDGLVEMPGSCRLNVEKLRCGTSNNAQCFSPGQIDALKKIYAGPPRSLHYEAPFHFLPSGSEVGRPVPFLGWDGYLAAGGANIPQQARLANGLLADFMQDRPSTIESFSWSGDAPRVVSALGPVLDVQPDMSKFFARGGKLILWHGTADAAIPLQLSIDFYRKILNHSGPHADDGARLFLIPGMQHCFGGTGADQFGEQKAPKPDALPGENLAMALRQWVEGGPAPESVVGTGTVDGFRGSAPTSRQRLHCAFPKRPHLKNGSDQDLARNYTCR